MMLIESTDACMQGGRNDNNTGETDELVHIEI